MEAKKFTSSGEWQNPEEAKAVRCAYGGGPAFPLQSIGPDFQPGYSGMSLRDYFAAKAMQGLLANPGGPIQANGMSGWDWRNCSSEDVANLAYAMADAMLEARGK